MQENPLNNNSFLSLEDEVNLRLQIRTIYKNGGMQEVLQCLGEIASSLEVVAQVAEELIKEENNKK